MQLAKPKLVRITSLPVSMKVLLKGQMHFMKEQGFEVTMISSDGDEVKSLVEQEGCPHIPVTLTRKISPFTDLSSLFQLIRLFRKIKPHIVHTHTPKAGLLGMWAALLSGVPIRLHTIAGLPWVETKGAMRLLLKTVEKLTALPANKIYPNSKVQEAFLKKEGIARNKMKVLGSGSSNGNNCNYFAFNNQ
jgi:UDP-N-acetylglucosamine:LPS N-acetylglucosamine transferase